MKVYIALALAVVALGAGVYIVHSGKASAAPSCTSTPESQCASEDFHRGYHRWVSLRDKLAHSQGSESVATREQWQDEFDGLTARLNRGIGQGKIYDEGKDRIVDAPKPPAPPAPVPPGPPVPAKK